MPRPSLRPRGFDDLGLRRALGDRMLPLLVAAMAFLAALAGAGAVGAAALADHWRQGAGAAMTVQVPRPGSAATPVAGTAEETRVERVTAILRGTPGLADTHALPESELNELLRPWLGGLAETTSLPLPGVVAVRLAGDGMDDAGFAALAGRLAAAAPGTTIEAHRPWVRRLSLLARSLQACAWAALGLVTGVAACVIAVATRGGLAVRREVIETVHGLGATDGYIAQRFARRAAGLAGVGALIGAVAALPVLVGLANLAAPFTALDEAGASAGQWFAGGQWLAAVPAALWLGLPVLPLAAGMIGFATAQGTVRRWLRRLP